MNNSSLKDAAGWPMRSNALAPGWAGRSFGQAISLGSFCHSAMALKRAKFRLFSGPFDWIFSSPEVVAHILRDDFREFLDPRHYRPVPLEERITPEANRCDHRFYREKFGLQFMFNHHSPDQPDDHAYLERTVQRFRAALGATRPPLFLMVDQHPTQTPRHDAVVDALESRGHAYGMLVIRFVRADASEGQLSDDPVRVVFEGPRVVALELRVGGLSNGVEFSENADNQRLTSVLQSFDVTPYPQAVWEALSGVSAPRGKCEREDIIS